MVLLIIRSDSPSCWRRNVILYLAGVRADIKDLHNRAICTSTDLYNHFDHAKVVRIEAQRDPPLSITTRLAVGLLQRSDCYNALSVEEDQTAQPIL